MRALRTASVGATRHTSAVAPAPAIAAEALQHEAAGDQPPLQFRLMDRAGDDVGKTVHDARLPWSMDEETQAAVLIGDAHDPHGLLTACEEPC